MHRIILTLITVLALMPVLLCAEIAYGETGIIKLGQAPTVKVKSQEALKPAVFLKAVPNPLGPRTNISFTLYDLSGEKVSLKIFTLDGKLVKTLFMGKSLKESIVWHGRDDSGKRVVSGVYIARLNSESFSFNKKLVLIR